MDHGIGFKRVKAGISLAVMLCAVFLLASCSGDKTKEADVTVDLGAVMESVSAYTSGEDMIDLSADELLSFYGIEESECAQFAAKINVSGVSADEIVFIEAANADAAQSVKEKLENRYKAKLNETKNYFPAEYEKIEAASVEQNGNFVSMVISSDADEINAVYKAAFN
ncbi:MAG: DUF4358 domain-containing protein [Clostridia bacterium]|nr:DUF4358 domain-containing protein [Clostridia bacterium]